MWIPAKIKNSNSTSTGKCVSKDYQQVIIYVITMMLISATQCYAFKLMLHKIFSSFLDLLIRLCSRINLELIDDLCSREARLNDEQQELDQECLTRALTITYNSGWYLYLQ